jgi:mannose-6-phosphate isomerase-like protein (cupin superfamily)
VKPVVRQRGPFRWEGIELEPYTPDETHFRDVSRQVLFGKEAGLSSELRYFEIGPGGHSTLERHEHVHAVMILNGAGRVLVGDGVFDVEPHDLVRVPPRTWHQLRADAERPLGFLCLVDAERDRPSRPSEADLEQLRRNPEVAAFIRP